MQREYDASMCGTQYALPLLQLLVSIISSLALLPPSACSPGILALRNCYRNVVRQKCYVSLLTALRFARLCGDLSTVSLEINEVIGSVKVTLLFKNLRSTRQQAEEL